MEKRQEEFALTFELRESIAEFLSEYQFAASPKTLRYYEDNVGRCLLKFLTEHGAQDVQDVTPAILRQYLIFESNHGLSTTTVIHRHRSAKRSFAWCIEQDYLEANPMAKVAKPRAPQPLRQGYAKEELTLLLQYAAKAPGWLKVRDRAIVVTLVGTGARAMELLAMRPEDIDWKRRTILLHGKGKKDRRVPMGRKVFRALQDYYKVRPATPWMEVWCTQRRTRMNYAALNSMIKNLGGYAGVRDVTPHRFRHTFATEHYRANRDLIALKAALGHSKVETTMTYLRGLGLDFALDAEHPSPDKWLVE